MTDKNPKHKTKPIIGISLGDINGIGPEVILKSLRDSRVTNFFVPVIYASGGIISYYRKQFNMEDFGFHQTRDFENINPKKVNVVNVWDEKVEVTPGNPNPSGGHYARKSLEHAVADLKERKLQAVVTAPWSKDLVMDEEFNFPGHTEYLTHVFEQDDSLMLMVAGDLRVGVVTGHLPLSEVSGTITRELLERKLSMLIKSLQKDFGIKKPKVAVLGLNPHAGENGALGSEEKDTILPTIEEVKSKGHLIFGPFPADGFFGAHQHRNFDAVLAMYHDQGLIPFKYIAGGEGVNFTAGIPAIRTSPAHGTAFDLAGKNLADHASMYQALFLAYDLTKEAVQEADDQ